MFCDYKKITIFAVEIKIKAMMSFATSVILASKPFAWLYDVGFVKSYDWFCAICRAVLQAVGKGAEKVMCAFLPGSLKEIPATKPVVKTSSAQQEK